ncbi:unnamed protein product [Prunus brigantina]
MRCGCARVCQHGLLCVEMLQGRLVVVLVVDFERCSESDGRMIYGVNETITGMVLRRLKRSRVV